MREELPIQTDHEDWEMVDDILDGSQQPQISHEGEDLHEAVQSLEKDLWKSER